MSNLTKNPLSQNSHEQARLKLMGHAMMGDEGAMDLLDLMFNGKFPATSKALKDNKADQKSA